VFLLPSAIGAIQQDPIRRIFKQASLDLQFAEKKSLVDATTGSNLVTFTRASSGTFVGSDGVLQTATNDVPRFDHNPTTGESLGLMVEEQRTNLLLRSEEFGTTWGAGNVTVTSNNIAAPNGTVTAEKITDSVDVSNNAHQLTQGVAVLSGVAYTVSAFIKAGNGVGFSLGAGSVGAFTTEQRVLFNATTGVATSQLGTPANITMTAVANGWYRCSCTITPTSSATATIVVRLYNSAASGFYTGDGTQFAYLWGAQLEAGAFPTSYIPTTTATVTRSADVASIGSSAFSSWYRQDEGTVFAEFGTIGSTGATQPALQFNNGADTTRTMVSRRGDGKAGLNVVVSSVTSCDLDSGVTLAVGSIVKTASVYKLDDFAIVANASSAVVDTSGSIPTNDRANIGSRIAGTYLNGLIRRLTYWPTRLSNSTLQQLTQ
jgi:hypothetical protein